MYADDTVCIIEPDKNTLRSLFDELGWFAKYSGLRPNLEKTKAMLIGQPYNRNKDLLERNIKLNWCQAITILGVTFENNPHNILTYNIQELTRAPLGGGAISSPPLVFLRYLLNQCRYHHQTCSTLSPNYFTHCVKILKFRVL